METKNLIRMANDIGSFFVSYPDEEQAKRGYCGAYSKVLGPRYEKTNKRICY